MPVTKSRVDKHSFCFVIQVMTYFMEQVLAVYGLLSNLDEGFAINNIVFIFGTILFSVLIFSTCDIAQRVTEEVGKG
jgi:hypothetical protein